MSTDRPRAQSPTKPLAERRVVHQLPAGAAVNVDAALARCFGPELIQALERRRAERAQASHGGGL